MLGKLLHLEVFYWRVAVDLNNTVYCHLWLFKIGVVYLSPKPHQIRMSMQSKTLEVGVCWGHKRDAFEGRFLICKRFCLVRNCELGLCCKRRMGKWLSPGSFLFKYKFFFTSNEVLSFSNSLFALHTILSNKHARAHLLSHDDTSEDPFGFNFCVTTLFSGLQQDLRKEREDWMSQWLSFCRSCCFY